MRALWVCLLWLFCSAAAGAAGATDTTDTGLLRLDHADRLVTAPAQYLPVTNRLALPEGRWTPTDLPDSYADSPTAGTRPGAMATSWYRISLQGLADTPGPLALHLLRWQAAGQLAVYGDGQLLYRSLGTPTWNHFRHPALYIALREGAEMPLPHQLVIRLDTYAGAGGAISSLVAGPAGEVYRHYASREWLEYQLPFMMSAAFLAVGLFSLCIWVARRREPIYLLVFAIAACTVTRRWHFYAGLDQLMIPDQWFGWLTYNALNWQVVALQYFARLLHRREHRWFNRVLVAVAIVMTVVTLPLSALQPGLVLLKPMLYLAPIVAGILITLRNTWDAWRSPSYEARLLAGWMLLSLVFGIYDWFKVKYQFHMESFYLTPYAAMVMFVVITTILFRRYVNAIAATERSKDYLALRLRQREEELAESYQRLREVEHARTLSSERQRMMQDMHDVLGLSLVGALRMIERGQLDEHEVAQILSSCIDDLKLAIDSLEPVDADLLLLLATLRFRLGPRLEAAGIRLQWQVETVPPLPWLDPRHALHILRILQECFANIIKHTRASEIVVSTAVGDGYVMVVIADNGSGFKVEAGLARGGKGLRNQLRRADALGASIRWQSGDDGTRMKLILPLVQPQPA